MKKLLSLILILWSGYGFSQSCGYTLPDTVFNNTATLITASTARINGDAGNGDVGGTTIVLRYVRVGQVDTVVSTTVWPTSLRNLTGLTAGTQYVYYYTLNCGTDQLRQLGRYYFTTATSTVLYAQERPTYFSYVKADSGLIVPRLDTGLNRSPNIGGQIKFRPADSLFYGYNGLVWSPLAVDSSGIITLLDDKVDSVTVAGDSLWYWKLGVSYGYILPGTGTVTSVAAGFGTDFTTITATGSVDVDSTVMATHWYVDSSISVGASGWGLTGNAGTTSATNFLGTTDNVSLRLRTNNNGVAVLDSNGRLGIGLTYPLDILDIYQSINDYSTIHLENDNAGVAAGAFIRADVGTSYGSFYQNGNSFVTTGTDIANQTVFGGNGAGGLQIAAAHGSAPIIFTNAIGEWGRFSITGLFGVGTNAPDSLITSHLGLHAKRGVRFSGLPTSGTYYKTVRATSDGTLFLSDTAAAGGSGTVNSGTQYRLGYYAATGTAISEAGAITASRALISDANGVPTHSTTTTTQLQYLNAATGTTGTASTNVVFSTSPALTTPTVVTSIVGGASFDAFNTTSTTVNAFGAATTLNIGAGAAQVLNFGGFTTAAELRFLEPSGSGTNYSGFKAVAQAGNITYSLPPALVAGGALTDVAGNGVLTWVVPSGGSLTVGTTSITSGTGGRMLYETSGNKLGEITGATSDGTTATFTLPSMNNVKGTYATTATAATTTTLTVSSTYEQYFTGVTTQTVVMPDATTLTVGMAYRIVNNSTGVVTVNKNGGTLIKAVAAGTELFVQVTDISSAAGVYSTGYSTDLAIGTATATKISYAAGTTSVSPINLAAGTLLTTPGDGDIETDADAMYGTTDAGNRGVIPITHFIRADATRTFTSNTSQQAIFDAPTNGTLTLETGTYFFEGLIAMTSMSGSSGNGKFSLIGAGTATLGAILWQAYGNDVAAEAAAAATGGSWHIIATQTAVNVVTAAVGTELAFLVKGTFEVTGAGTIIPSFAQTTSSAAVISIGTYFKCNRVGSTSVTNVGQWN